MRGVILKMRKLMNDNKGVSRGMLTAAAGGLVLVTVLFAIINGLIGQVVTNGNSINTTLGGSGLAPLFAGNGSVIVLVILAGALLAVVFFWLKMSK